MPCHPHHDKKEQGDLKIFSLHDKSRYAELSVRSIGQINEYNQNDSKNSGVFVHPLDRADENYQREHYNAENHIYIYRDFSLIYHSMFL